MELGFRQAADQALFRSAAQLRKTYGAACATVIVRRLAQMRAAANLDSLLRLPQVRSRRVDGTDRFMLDLEEPRRLVVEVADQPAPRYDDGTLDATRVTRLAIIEVFDSTHDGEGTAR